MATEKKKWFEVEIPMLNTKVKLIAMNIEQLNNRTIKLDLTRQLRGKSLEALVKIKVENGKADGEVVSMNLLGFFIRRMMRTNINYVEDSFSAETLDSFLRIKPFLITRKKVTRAVQKALRENCRKFVEEYLKERTKEEVLYDLINNKFQKTLSVRLKKTYPLALCEIRMISIEKLKENIVIDKSRVKKALPEELIQEKSQIEEIEAELAEKAGKEIKEEPVKEKTQAEEFEEEEKKAEEVKEEKKEEPVKEKKPKKKAEESKEE